MRVTWPLVLVAASVLPAWSPDLEKWPDPPETAKEFKMPALVSQDTWAVLTVVGEALSEPYDGKLAVAEVIRNRMRRRYASDGTVIGTVLRPKQFSMWDFHQTRTLAAKSNNDHAAVRSCETAWQEATVGGTDIAKGAVLYLRHDVDPKPAWTTAPSVKLVGRIGAHLFYTDKGGA